MCNREIRQVTKRYHLSWIWPILDFGTFRYTKPVGKFGTGQARSENGFGKWHTLVWNRVRIWRNGGYTPTKNSKEYPTPGNDCYLSEPVISHSPDSAEQWILDKVDKMTNNWTGFSDIWNFQSQLSRVTCFLLVDLGEQRLLAMGLVVNHALPVIMFFRGERWTWKIDVWCQKDS